MERSDQSLIAKLILYLGALIEREVLQQASPASALG
jgi:hypothetical protein